MDIHVISDYYFLASALPPIRLGDPLEMSFNEFDFLQKANLSALDRKETRILRRFYDVQNLRYLWMGQELDNYGNLNPAELEESVLSGIGIPGYIYEFTERYEEQEDRLQNFPQLVSEYFSTETARSSGFVKEYLSFERELRLVFSALRAKRMEKDIMKEFQYEDPNDPLVAHIIAQKDAGTYEPLSRHEPLKAVYEANAENPTELYKALAELKFDTIDAMLGVDMFSINRINGYMIQLIIAEKWLELDKQKGLEILDTLAREAS